MCHLLRAALNMESRWVCGCRMAVRVTVVHPHDRWRTGSRGIAAQRQETSRLRIASPGKESHSTLEVRFLLNAYRVCTIVKSEILSQTVRRQGPWVLECLLYHSPH